MSKQPPLIHKRFLSRRLSTELLLCLLCRTSLSPLHPPPMPQTIISLLIYKEQECTSSSLPVNNKYTSISIFEQCSEPSNAKSDTFKSPACCVMKTALSHKDESCCFLNPVCGRWHLWTGLCVLAQEN